jgi:phi13 family phage major tail protein
MALNEHDRPSVSTKRFATALLTEDSGTALTYGPVEEIATTLITAKYTPKMNSASMYASGIAVESYVAKAGGTLDITVVGLTAKEEQDYFGATVLSDSNDLIVENANDYVPDRMVMWSTQRSDGKMNLYKVMKAKFASQGEEATTSDDNGVTYNGTALQAEYKATVYSGDIMFKEKKVDPSTPEGAALIDAWFATALGGIVLTGTGSDANAPAVTATGGTNKVTLTWDAVTGATKYMVKQYDNGICTVLEDAYTTTSYEDTGLTAGKTYSYIVQAYVDGIWSSSGAAYLVSATAE